MGRASSESEQRVVEAMSTLIANGVLAMNGDATHLTVNS